MKYKCNAFSAHEIRARYLLSTLPKKRPGHFGTGRWVPLQEYKHSLTLGPLQEYKIILTLC